MKPQKNGAYTLGLDIGIASVGWCVLGENRVMDMGVRCFDKAETAKEGESLNLKRRMARLARHRLQHRRARLNQVARALHTHGLIPSPTFFRAFTQNNKVEKSLWQLRVDGLDRVLNTDEWARVIYHLCKHRGFYWVSKAEAKAAEGDTKGEGGKVKQALSHTKQLMGNYRTAAEMVMKTFVENKSSKFVGAARNQGGDYGKSLSRELLAEELITLFQKQRDFGNTHASAELEQILMGSGDKKSGLFWMQKSALSGAGLLKMLGHCTFEKHEYRAPKNSFSAERHVWLTRLNNLRIVINGEIRALSEAERQAVINAPYEYSNGEITYKQLAAKLVEAGFLAKGSFKFSGLRYPSLADSKGKDPETDKLTRLKGWVELKAAFVSANALDVWQKLSGEAFDGKPQALNQMAWVLAIYKEDAERLAELKQLNLPINPAVMDRLLEISFKEFSSLSLKALEKIVPFMEKGARYDEACNSAGYHHSLPSININSKVDLLPSFYVGADHRGKLIFNPDMDVPKNPVVLRALNQARKVVNAIIREYGAPMNVHIEVAKDLSKPHDERIKIEKEQKEFQERNEKDRKSFYDTFHFEPNGQDFLKWQLYREQQGKCAYSLHGLDINRLFEKGYVEIDHALPYSRSFDDSKNNKVLVLTSENRNKGNQTPFEYLDGNNNSERWQAFCAFVHTSHYRQAKKNRLLRSNLGEDDTKSFFERNLNDTRYICKFFKNYVEKYLQLAPESNHQRCVVVNGQTTALLRARWGFAKVRSESDRHHALDAAIVAACSHKLVKRMAEQSKRHELEGVRSGFVDAETGEVLDINALRQLEEKFPKPWTHFYEEVLTRLNTDDPEKLRAELSRLGTYSDEDLAKTKPVFVSRAPQRRNSGAVHLETIYGRHSHIKANEVVQTISVENLTLSQLDNIIGAGDGRNEGLMHSIRLWLESKDTRESKIKSILESLGRGTNRRELSEVENKQLETLKAFPRKPLKGELQTGIFTGPYIRTVKVNIGKKSGIPIRDGIAANDSMLRVDVFQKNGKYFLIPIYVHHQAIKQLPNLAIVAHKDESEWEVVDESYHFCFSFHANDLIEITQQNEKRFGYYAGCNRSTGAIDLWAHDRNLGIGKNGLFQSVGVKTAKAVQKFNVDVLGRIYPCQPESRQPL